MVKNAEKQTSMNKEGLIASTAEISGLSKADSARAVEAIIESIQKGLKEGKSITLVGFGSFSVQKREAREGRNPRTGETIKIAASKNPKFRAGKTFKEAIS
jgi:DNA-binding protein HU-beta